MGLLDEIASGGSTSALDIEESITKGKRDYQALQMQALQIEDFISKREHEKRLRDSLKGTDFTTPEGAAEASMFASEAEDPEMAITLSKLSASLKGKDRKDFGNMKPIYSNGKHLGYAQKDATGKLHNFKTIANIEGKKKSPKASKVGKPTNEQIESATEYVSKSKAFGEEGVWNVGLSSDDTKRLGRVIASRSNKLQADAKDMGKRLSDQEAMDIASKEVEAMGKNVLDTSGWFGGKELVEKIKFKPGTSTELQKFYGISTSAVPTGPVTIKNVNDFNNLPSGTVFIDPNGVKRTKP